MQKDFTTVWDNCLQIIKDNASLIKQRAINISSFSESEIKLNFDLKCYEKYKEKFIKLKNSDRYQIAEILANYLKSIS